MPPVTVLAYLQFLMLAVSLYVHTRRDPPRSCSVVTYYHHLCLRTFMVRNTTHTQTSVTYVLRLFLNWKHSNGGLMPLLNGVTLRLQYNTLPPVWGITTLSGVTYILFCYLLSISGFNLSFYLFFITVGLSPVIFRRASKVHLYNIALR